MAVNGTQWHWAEGMKYALEGTKLLFILNGGAAISVLTFIGNTKAGSRALIVAMILFALGAFSAVLTMVFAYLAQLHYGNAAQGPGQNLDRASEFHCCAYVTVIGSGLLFLGGIVAAACGLLVLTPIPKP